MASSSTKALVFCVVRNDAPIFECNLSDAKAEDSHFSQFVLHASLDMVEETLFTTQSSFLRVVDRFNDNYVSAYATQGGIVMLLMHDNKPEESIRHFFQDMHEAVLKIIMNPFHRPTQTIASSAFDRAVAAAARRYLLS